MAVLHEQSSAVEIIRETNAGKVLSFKGKDGVVELAKNFGPFFKEFESFKDSFYPGMVDQSKFEKFSAVSVTQKLSELVSRAINLT
jgi:hypothetical protein